MNRTRASVLIGLLWCLALLSVLVVGVLHSSTIDLRVVKNYGDQVQAHYLALAGIEKAKALLFHDAASRRRSAHNHTSDLYDAPREFKDVPFGRGQFRVFRQSRREERGGVIYGIDDEESRLNLNRASAEELGKLYDLTPDIAAAILDWRDEDDTPSAGGAEIEYYSSLIPPYLPRNGPFQTTRELLMVRGVSLEQFAGEDVNGNGLLDPEEDDGNESYPPDNRDGVLDAGWSGSLTVDSSVRNVNAAGQARVNVQSAEESALAAVPGISTDLAKAIVAYRGQNKLESLADLLEVRAMRQQGQPRSQVQTQTQPEPNAPPNRAGSRSPGTAPDGSSPGSPPSAAQPNSGGQPEGPPLISAALLMDIADDLTTSDERELAGAVNINTASLAVLICLPGITQELAQAIILSRQSAGYFANIVSLLKVPGFNSQLLKQLAPRITARSETFRILSEGEVTSTGARQRIQIVVRVGETSVKTVSYREDL